MLRKLLIALFVIFSMDPVLAQQTQLGDFGLVLGTEFDRSKAAGIISRKNGQIVYSLRKNADTTRFPEIQVAVTSKNIIFNIIATTKPMSSQECVSMQAAQLKRLRARFKSLEYYANGDADMIYDKQATVVLECKMQGDKSLLRIEYLHDKIYQALPSK